MGVAVVLAPAPGQTLMQSKKISMEPSRSPQAAGPHMAFSRGRILGSRLSIAPVISTDEGNRFSRTSSARARELTQRVRA